MGEHLLRGTDDETPACHGCGRTGDPVEVRPGEPLAAHPTAFVYPTVSRGRIGFCDLCFAAGRFDGLSDEDVEVVTLLFGDAFAEDCPLEGIRLLEPLLPKWRAPDLLSPLGRAYIRAGRVAEGRALLLEARAGWPEHPYERIDESYLRNS